MGCLSYQKWEGETPGGNVWQGNIQRISRENVLDSADIIRLTSVSVSGCYIAFVNAYYSTLSESIPTCISVMGKELSCKSRS
jgi:hypothetical protein